VVAGTAANEWGPSFSRDGKYIAYVADESGQYEVYVQPFPPDGRRWQVSTEGGEEPIWSGTGKELFYRRGLEWVAAEVSTTGGFTMKKSGVVISGSYVNVAGRSYDVTRDGNRFLVLERLDSDDRLTEIRVVKNWFQEVEGKMKGR
jgi:Tol biopolymer transport system component